MRGIFLAFVVVFALGVGPASATKYITIDNGCSDFLNACKTRSKLSEAQCQTLYDYAEKAGGRWGLPEARAASHTLGPDAMCIP